MMELIGQIGLLLAILVSFAYIVQRNRVRWLEREHAHLTTRIARSRQATADIFSLSRHVITGEIGEDEFLVKFGDYVIRSLQFEGAAVLLCKNKRFYGYSVSGRFPPLFDTSSEKEKEYTENAVLHRAAFHEMELDLSFDAVRESCRQKGFSCHIGEKPSWIPASFGRAAPVVFFTLIKVREEIVGALVAVSKNGGSHTPNDEDGYYLERFGELAATSLELIRVVKQRKEFEMRIQAAREEGMVQVSTGIIHNIGNAITVSKLAVLELKEKLGSEAERPETLILEEIIPNLKRKVEDETAHSFLKHDPIGSQYLEIMRQLLEHSKESSEKANEAIASLENKLNHIAEIIQLQQRFAGELGSEVSTDIGSIIDSAVKIFEESCNKRDVEIKTDYRPRIPNLTVDPSMLTQVFMNLIKNAIEAMEKDDSGRKHVLIVSLREELRNGKPHVVASFRDNGPGIPKALINKIFDFGFSTKGTEKTRGFGLAFCMNTIKRYHGIIEVDSAPGEGTAFNVFLPIEENLL